MSDERLSPLDDGEADHPASPAEHSDVLRRSDPPAAGTDPSRERPREYGGRKGPDPVRYGDWEKNGRCIDF